MPKVKKRIKDASDNFKPYLFHGINLDYTDNSKQAVGDCPFCGREEKFTVERSTSKYRCFPCGVKGNSTGFIRELWKLLDAGTNDYALLANSRGLLPETLMVWGMVYNGLSSCWCLPGYSPDGRMINLYRYSRIKGKMRFLGTPTIQGSYPMFGGNLISPRCETIYLCEGAFDGMAWHEALSHTRKNDDEVVQTASTSQNLLKDCSVIALPGVNSFGKGWAKLLRDKEVIVLFDNDHPRMNPRTKKLEPPVSYQAFSAIASQLDGEIQYLRWGDQNYEPDLADGYDINDLVKDSGYVEAVKLVQNRLETVEQEESEAVKNNQGTTLPCSDWKKLLMAWRKAMKWTEGLEYALSVMLASITSTKAVGDQLWIKVIGPASSGKSTLCEAVSTNVDYVLAKSTIRGFHSGYKTDREGAEDNSLVAKLYDMTLVTKDGDTLLQSPNLGQILSEARDIYDCTSRTHYRNKTSRDYQGVRMTWLLCGTSSLRSIDSSELGERFLDCVIMEDIDPDYEDEVLLRVSYKAQKNIARVSDGKPESRNDPETYQAMALTGGYVDYLRDNASELLGSIDLPEWARYRCIALGKWVAFMRARPSQHQTEKAEREFAARLVSQHVRLAMCLAVVMQRKEVDADVMRRVKQVSDDTSRGRTREIVELLYEAGDDGMTSKALAASMNYGQQEVFKLLRFLRDIGVLKQFRPKVNNVRTTTRHKLTPRLSGLYEAVYEEELSE